MDDQRLVLALRITDEFGVDLVVHLYDTIAIVDGQFAQFHGVERVAILLDQFGLGLPERQERLNFSPRSPAGCSPKSDVTTLALINCGSSW